MASPVWRFIDIMLPLIEKGGFCNSNQMGHQLMNLKPPSPTLLSLAGFLSLTLTGLLWLNEILNYEIKCRKTDLFVLIVGIWYYAIYHKDAMAG